MRLPVLLLILFVSCAPAWADSYAVISFHDVRDDARDLGPDDITTARLTDFFDWLAGNGWSVVSIDDLEAARMGKKPLPPKAILLTFDDGYSSIYTRVYPLLRAYGFHAVFFLVGSWMDVAPGGMVQYGDEVVPRDRFLSWDQAREMTASGLAEFGSHTYRLHLGVRGNPQGSSMPAAATWTYDPKTDLYETDAALEARVAEDLGRSAASMRRELGRAPRVLAWPFGRTSGPAMAAAHKEGFTYVMGLAEELADTSSPLAIQRLYPTRNPTLSAITSSLNFGRTDPEQRRIACLSLDRIVGSSEAETDAALGRTIEDLRRPGFEHGRARTVCFRKAWRAPPRGLVQEQPPPDQSRFPWFRGVANPVARRRRGLSASRHRCRRRQCRTRPRRRPRARACPRRPRRWHHDRSARAIPGGRLHAHIVPALECPGRARPDHRRGRGRQRARPSRARCLGRGERRASPLPAGHCGAVAASRRMARARRRCGASEKSGPGHGGAGAKELKDRRMASTRPRGPQAGAAPGRGAARRHGRRDASGAGAWRIVIRAVPGVIARKRNPQRGIFRRALSPPSVSAAAMEHTTFWLLEAVPVFCFGYPFVMSFYWMIGSILFWLGAERHFGDLAKPPPLPRLPPISIIVPCYNEAEGAAETFGALTAIDYPDFEIIAVNDGSKDNTAQILGELAQSIPHLRVVNLAVNQGKATAMNVGALLARHELLVLIDGDALLDPNALRWVAWHFRHPLLGGITGNPRIRNRSSILGRLQVGEFSSIIGLIKRAQATYARMYTVSGVICAFRKRALSDAGWWSPRTLTDDVDITWRVQIADWRITYAPNMVVWILMPETLRGLWRQRLRWAEGGAHMLADNARPIFSGKSPSLLPVYVNAVVSVVWAYCIILATALGVLHEAGVPVLPQIPTFSLIPGWFGLTLCATYLLQAALSLRLERRFEPKGAASLFWIIWYPVAFWMLSALTTAVALPRAIFRPRAARTTWVSPDRGLR